MLLTYKPGRFKPGWNKAQARRLLAFGLPLSAANIIGFLVLNVDYITVGHILGAEALGLYMLAFNISGWPLNVFGAVIRSVSLPGFSHLRREGADEMPRHYVGALKLVTSITLPICMIIGALAHSAVIAIYGSRWAPAAGALVGLSLLGAGRIILELTGDFLITQGRTKGLMYAQIAWLIALTTVLILIEPHFGIKGVGWAQAGVVVAVVGPIYAVLLRRNGVRLALALRAVAPAIVWSLLAAVVARLVADQIPSPFLACAAGASAGLIVAAIPFHRAIMRRVSVLLRDRNRRARVRRSNRRTRSRRRSRIPPPAATRPSGEPQPARRSRLSLRRPPARRRARTPPARAATPPAAR